MTAFVTERPVDATALAYFEIVQDTLAILEDERVAFLTGAYDRVEEIVGRKRIALARLEEVLPQAPRSEEGVGAIRHLIAVSRRNEQIIQAARQGLAHARRRVAVIRDAARGVVAYAEDGTRIASRADLIGGGKSA